MAKPIETVIVRAQQNFEIAGEFNPVQIEIEDGRVLNIFKKHKNTAHKLTPLGMLFPASIKNNIEQISITCRELNDVKQSVTILSSKIYVLLGIIDLKKINNWNKIKGQSLWINATLEEQREISNSRHLCFPLMALTLNNFLNFSINLIDDNNKETEFVSNEK